MTNRNTGGPAFPNATGDDRDNNGMTLRDYFAAKAMQGDISSYITGQGINAASLAKWSYEIADAMLKARET